jgi:hypothetical protein
MGLPALLAIRKEVMLRIFKALKNPSSSAGFELVNLGFSGKHDTHETTEGDFLLLCLIYNVKSMFSPYEYSNLLAGYCTS